MAMTVPPEANDDNHRKRHHTTASMSKSTSTGLGLPQPKSTSYLPGSTNISKAVWVGRCVFIVCLLISATVLGALAFHFLTEAEVSLGEAQFRSIAGSAIDSAVGITIRKRLGTVSMAGVAGHFNPDPDAWPFVEFPGYETISTNIIETSDGRGMGFVPFVKPEQIEEFTDYAYDYYEKIGYPDTAGLSEPFGRGIWAPGPGGRIKVTDGNNTYDSPHDIVAPIMLHNRGVHSVLLLDIHYEPFRGNAIDELISCSNGQNPSECRTALTDMIFLNNDEDEAQPGGLIMEPIYPANGQGEMTGVLASSIQWIEVLKGVFPRDVSGIDCVVESDTQSFTYSIINGKPKLKGEGDLHNPRYSSYKLSKSLTGKENFSAGSANCTIYMYPTSEFFEVYSTANPVVATIGAVATILITSFLFLIYDFCVRREFNQKRDLLESKRKFVRFVSHEVRTPLNSVCMGLTLLREEIDSAMEEHQLKHNCSGTVDTTDLSESSGEKCEMRAIGMPRATEWLHLAKEVYANAQSSVDVLNDLLNYDKIEMGNLTLELTVIPIWKLIQTTASEFKLPATKKQISLDVRCLEPTPPDLESGTLSVGTDAYNQRVIGDVVRLTQVLRNLMSNALKFTPNGGNLSVTLSWTNVPITTPRTIELAGGNEIICNQCGALNVTVKDTGAGMSPEQVAKLFRNGIQFNVNELQAGQGSGLGLFIARGIMEQHGGTLTASSEGLKKGTTFTMRMPLFDVPEDELHSSSHIEELNESLVPQNSEIFTPPEQLPKQPASEAPQPVEATSQSSTITTEPAAELSTLRILIVDDAAMNRKLLRRLLQRHGHVCEEAEDGYVAVNMVKESMGNEQPSYDAILLDFEMPVMNGPTAAKKIREMGCDAFIVGITGNVLPEDVLNFKSNGANGVLSKPFKLPELDELWAEYGMGGSIITKRPSQYNKTPQAAPSTSPGTQASKSPKPSNIK